MGEGYEVICATDHLAARLRGVAEEVVGEDPAPRFPLLGVQVAAVPGLQLLDRLDLQQGSGIIHPVSVTFVAEVVKVRYGRAARDFHPKRLFWHNGRLSAPRLRLRGGHTR